MARRPRVWQASDPLVRCSQQSKPLVANVPGTFESWGFHLRSSRFRHPPPAPVLFSRSYDDTSSFHRFLSYLGIHRTKCFPVNRLSQLSYGLQLLSFSIVTVDVCEFLPCVPTRGGFYTSKIPFERSCATGDVYVILGSGWTSTCSVGFLRIVTMDMGSKTHRNWRCLLS